MHRDYFVTVHDQQCSVDLHETLPQNRQQRECDQD